MESKITIETCEMHTGGEPVRIVESGYPKFNGSTILEKRREAKLKFDNYRKLLMWEPRGHADMYGALLVPQDHPEADLAVLFLNNEGYSPMCGHATIALARYAADRGLGKSGTSEGQKEVNVQCPCGLVRTIVSDDGSVCFLSVPSFAFALDVEISVPGIGPVMVDIGFGGAFYAVVSANKVNLNVNTSTISELIAMGTAVKNATRSVLSPTHPTDPDLSDLYGTIFTDGQDDFTDQPTTNVCIFADGQVDRSPTGSGVCARLALQFRRRQITTGQTRRFKSRVGSEFAGEVVSESNTKDVEGNPLPTVIVKVSGKANYTGKCTFTLESNDHLGAGFLVS